MKKTSLVAIFIIIFSINANSASNTNIEIGVNYSSLRTEGGTSKPGLCFGVGRDIYPFRSFNGYIGFGLSYVRRTVRLENKTWPSGFYTDDSDIVYGDIIIDESYLDLPVKLGYHFNKSKSISINIYTSLTLSIPIKNHTIYQTNKIVYLTPDEKGTFYFDYYKTDETYLDKFTNAQIGFILFFKKVGLGCRYEKALTETDCTGFVLIKDKIDSFQIMVHVYF